MAQRILATIGLLVLIPAAGGALALTGHAGGTCTGGQHVVTAGGFYDAEADAGIVGIVFLRQAVGACLPDQEVPATPVPLEIFASSVYPGQEYTATATLPAPEIPVVYRYVALAVREDGTREPVAFSGNGYPPQVLVCCGDRPFLRGVIAEDPVYSSPGYPLYTFLPVAQGCWTEILANVVYTPAQLEEMLGGTMAQLLGETVDVYGEIAAHDLVPAPSHWISRVELLDPSVPAAPTGWGAVKARYR